jgi:hypothetical protein
LKRSPFPLAVASPYHAVAILVSTHLVDGFSRLVVDIDQPDVSVSGKSSKPGLILNTTPLKLTNLSGGVIGFSGDVATFLLPVNV